MTTTTTTTTTRLKRTDKKQTCVYVEEKTLRLVRSMLALRGETFTKWVSDLIKKELEKK